MAKYSYTGRMSDGELTKGVIEANDEFIAAKMLSARSIVPIEILAGTSSAENKPEITVNLFTPNVSLDDLVIFARQMYSLNKTPVNQPLRPWPQALDLPMANQVKHLKNLMLW